MRSRVSAVVVGLLASALLPLAHANAPPAVSWTVSPTHALLGEPVTFTDTSVDPDGTIVEVVWEFSDGRSVSGSSVTKSFDFPGRHETRLAVTDDAGATVLVAFEVVVLPTLMEGRASALRVGESRHADTGDVSTDQHSDHEAAVGEARNGGLHASGLLAELLTLDRRAVARADVAYVKIPVPIGYVLATGIEAEAIVGCAYPTILNAKFTQLRLNDGPLVPPGSFAPGTRIDLPGGGSVLLDVRESSAPGRLSVTAMRVDVPGAPPVEVARAEAGVRDCPYGT
ncbi:MAG TPA: PKD domain-containing protein [Candidatus Thermoplasmatota archaeon]|nr:PKD domain-containing protein [Candidatus Thermoplasmatota archaeon]